MKKNSQFNSIETTGKTSALGWKFVYLIGFLSVVFFGMTQLESNTSTLKKQSSDYSNRHNSINVRFKTVVGAESKITARPETLGTTSSSEKEYVIRFFLKNIGSQPSVFHQSMYLQSNGDLNLVKFKLSNGKRKFTLKPGETETVNWTYKVGSIGETSFDTVTLALVLIEIEVGDPEISQGLLSAPLN